MKTKILIIDDDEIDRMSLTRLIKTWRRRVTVLEAGSCTEAYRHMSSEEPDVVFCDWSMQPDDGFQFLRWVRDSAVSPNAELPVILTSGYVDDYMAAAAIDRGATAILEKPLQLQGLRDCLGDLNF